MKYCFSAQRFGLWAVLSLWLLAGQMYAQQDSTKNQEPEKPDMQAYDVLVKKGGITRQGLFTVRQIDDKWYFEVPDSLLGRYLLTVTRLTSAPQSFGMYGGEKLNEQTVYFEQNSDKRLFLRAAIYRQEADSTDNIYSAVVNSQVNPIVATFNVIGKNPDTGDAMIEVTDFFRKDNTVTGIPQSIKSDRKLGGMADDRSFIEEVRVYPINVEVKSTKTFSTSAGVAIPAGAQTGSVTMQLNTSIVLLPKHPMRKRLFDRRVGYFANKFTLFTDKNQSTQDLALIQRYRLEPKPQDKERYFKGELVEPKQQIVYYIDPATPKQWQPYLIQGINDWNEAFEAAGFKNAIVGKVWPDDSTMSLEDARFSVIRYFASDKMNAYGPRISDPRSGEIIESHIGWYHNVMKLVQRWYMIQAGPLDKRARKMELDEELMGQLIRFVSSHEVGHSLGLRHNMGASSQTPVEKLRDKKWLAANGHTVSIMDYARFNYVAQPEDNVGEKGIFPRIGIYDKWAIKWGYQYLPENLSETEEKEFLNTQIADALRKEPRLWFGGEGKNEDPRSQAEDLGDDSAKASEYGILNLKRVVDNLEEWTKRPDGMNDDLEDMHKAVRGQFDRYLYHVLKNLGGRYVDSDGYREIPRWKAKSVVAYLDRQVFEAPLWLYPQNIQAKIGKDAEKEILEQQEQILNIVLSPGMLHNLYNASLRSSDPYRVEEFLADLSAAVWKPANSGDERKNAYRRSLQRSYLSKIDLVVNPRELREGKALSHALRSDVKIFLLIHLDEIEQYVKNQSALQTNNSLERLHYEDLLIEIKRMREKRLSTF